MKLTVMFIGSKKRKLRPGSPKELLLSVSVTLDHFHSSGCWEAVSCGNASALCSTNFRNFRKA